jgi:hypothetical protein
MNRMQHCGLAVAFALVLVAGVVIGTNLNTPAAAQDGKAGAGATSRYTVIDTEGVNLIVTDNQKNTLYFYTVDQEDKPGADLHLRGTIDLNQVGKDTLKPTLLKSKK